MSNAFARDLNDAAEAWFKYADRVFGVPHEVSAHVLYPRYPNSTKLKTTIRKNVANHKRSEVAWDAFTHAFLVARGWTYNADTKQWSRADAEDVQEAPVQPRSASSTDA